MDHADGGVHQFMGCESGEICRAIDYIGGSGRGGGPCAGVAPGRGPPAIAVVLLLLHALTLGREPGVLFSHPSNGDADPWHARARFRPTLATKPY